MTQTATQSATQTATQSASRTAGKARLLAVKQDVSPLSQARASKRVGAGKYQVSESDIAKARQILDGKCDVIKSPLIEEADAYSKLFEQTPGLGSADTSWYTPVMDKLDVGHVAGAVGNTLLDTKSEQLFFLRYNYCRLQVRKIKDQVGDGQPSQEQARDVLRWDKRVTELRHQIAEWNLALVLAMAKRVRVPDMTFADLVSEGNLALLRAVEKFDAGRGFKFSTYACRAILKCFSRIGTRSSKIKGLINVEYDPKMERSDYQETRRGDHESDCAQALKEIFLSNKAQLSDIERSVLEHRFSLGSRQGAHEGTPTLQQVGQMVGLTKERVRQIQNKAMIKLRETLEKDFLER